MLVLPLFIMYLTTHSNAQPNGGISFFGFALSMWSNNNTKLDGAKKCESEGLHLRLASIKSGAQNALAQRACQGTGSDSCWIGASNVASNDFFAPPRVEWDIDHTMIPNKNNDSILYANWQENAPLSGDWCYAIEASTGLWRIAFCDFGVYAAVCDDRQRFSSSPTQFPTRAPTSPTVYPTRLPSYGPTGAPSVPQVDGISFIGYPLPFSNMSKSSGASKCGFGGLYLATIKSSAQNALAQRACQVAGASSCWLGASGVSTGLWTFHFVWDIDHDVIPNQNNDSSYANWDADSPFFFGSTGCVTINAATGLWASSLFCTFGGDGAVCDDRSTLSPSAIPTNEPTLSPTTSQPARATSRTPTTIAPTVSVTYIAMTNSSGFNLFWRTKEQAVSECSRRAKMRLATVRSEAQNRRARSECAKVSNSWSSECLLGATNTQEFSLTSSSLPVKFVWDIDRTPIPNVNNASVYANWDVNEPAPMSLWSGGCVMMNAKNGKWFTSSFCLIIDWLCDDHEFVSFSPSSIPTSRPTLTWPTFVTRSQTPTAPPSLGAGASSLGTSVPPAPVPAHVTKNESQRYLYMLWAITASVALVCVLAAVAMWVWRNFKSSNVEVDDSGASDVEKVQRTVETLTGDGEEQRQSITGNGVEYE